MFGCINGLLPTPILDYFTTNATIHAHHTRQRNIPHVTQTFGTISERAVTHKGPKTWIEIPQTIRLHQKRIIVLSEYRCHAWVCCGGGGVYRLAGWVCLGETSVCGHIPAGCVLLSPCSVSSLCFPESVSASMGSMPNQSVLCHVYCEYIIILYNLQP